MISTATEATGISLIAAALWGSGDFCGGLAVRRASPYLVVALAHALALVLLIAVAVATRTPLPDGHSIAFALAAGVVGGIGLVLLYAALALGKMGLSASVGGVVTAVIPLLVSLRTEGRPQPMQLVGFAIAAAAIWLIAYAPGGAHPRGVGLAAGAGVCFGLLLTLLKVAGSGGVIWALAFARLGSFAVAGILALILREKSTPANSLLRNRSFLGLIALSGIFDTGGNLLYVIATRVGRLDIAAVVSSLYPAATILLAAWLLKERTTRIQATGMVLALIAVSLISS